MNKSDDELLKSLITGGIVGGALAALLSDKQNRGENATLAAIAGAAIVASYNASQKAKDTKLPIYKIKDGSLVIEHPDGKIETLKENINRENKIPPTFKLSS